MSDLINLSFLASNLKLQNFSVQIDRNCMGADLIAIIKVQTGEEHIKLVHKGRTIFTDVLLKEQGVSDNSKIIISKETAKPYLPTTSPDKKIIDKPSEIPQISPDLPVPAQKPPKSEEILIQESILSNLYTWGQNSFGKLGTSSLEDSFFPVPIILLNTQFTQISCGASLTVALSKTGEIYQWGRFLYPKGSNPNFKSQLSPQPIKELKDIRFSKVAAGNNHILALDNRGDVWSWGEGACGQLGHGFIDNELYPKRVERLVGCRTEDIAAGGAHSAAVTKGQKCIVWGKNAAKQLGTGDNKERNFPTIVLGLSAEKVKCGSFHILWMSNEKVYLSGNNKDLMLLNENCRFFETGGTTSITIDNKGSMCIFDENFSVLQESVLNIQQIVSNGSDLLILSNSGDLIGKGMNKHGELGIGSTNSAAEWIPANLPFKVQSISCGSSHVAAIIEPVTLSYQVLQNKSVLSDTPIFCSDGTCQAHSLLLNSHTDPSRFLNQTPAGYRTDLPVAVTEQLISWLYCRQISSDLNLDQLSILHHFSCEHNLTHLSEIAKYELDLKTADLQYLMYFPELSAEKVFEEMTESEVKLKREREKKEKDHREEVKRGVNEMDIDEVDIDENSWSEGEETGANEVQPEVVEDPNERRKKILEALEKRSNPN